MSRDDEPTYYPPGANPAWVDPVCSLCGAAIGKRAEHQAAHTAWHASLVTKPSSEPTP